MRIISKSRLRAYWLTPERHDAEGPLRAWHAHVKSKSLTWHKWGDVRASFATASIVGNCVVFNISGNRYRLITRIFYRSQKVFILRVMTHEEYDDEKWKEDCGCFTPPPSKSAKPRRRPPRKKGRKGH